MRMDRNQEIYEFRSAGHTLTETGERFGISRNRVAQIIHAYETKEKYDLFQELKKLVGGNRAGQIFTYLRWVNIYTVADLKKEYAVNANFKNIYGIGDKTAELLKIICEEK